MDIDSSENCVMCAYRLWCINNINIWLYSCFENQTLGITLLCHVMQELNPARYDILIMHLYRYKKYQHFSKHLEPLHVAAVTKHMVLFLLCKYEMEPEHNNSFIVSLYICSEHLRIPDCIINCQWNVPWSQSSALLTK